MERSEEALRERVRETPLSERLKTCEKYVAIMCAERRPPKMTIPLQHYDEDFYIYTTLADAQATIAALQARVKELEAIKIPDDAFTYCAYCGEKSPVDEHNEDLSAHIKVCPKHPIRDVEAQLTQRTAERDCARRRVDELEAREVDVVLLREDLEKRTAELEAAKRERDEIIQASIKEPIHEPVTYQALAGARSVAKLAYGELIKMTKRRDDLQAELERVRDQFADLRKMVAALPKVEGKIEVHTFKNTNQVVVTYNRGIIIGTLYGLDHAKPVAALYEHRQGMEG